MRLKTKLSLSLVFLFIVILVFGILGIVSINKLSNDAARVLNNNQESLVYANHMLTALEEVRVNRAALGLFEENLRKQESNITEAGEPQATAELRKNFEELKVDPTDSANYPEIRHSIYQILELNETAIERKNTTAQATAAQAKGWLTVIFTILTLIAFTLIFNLPGIISNPISTLSEGISEIANKNYSKRIFLKQGDEFGDLAKSFNIMAGRLDEYENSNLSKITFEKRRIETIINQMRDGIIGLDEKRNVLFLNAVAEKLFNIKESAIIGRYAPDIALQNDLMRTLLTDDPAKEELRIFADNKESYFNKEVLDVMNNNQLIGQVIVLKNITLFHELSEAKTNFIATISHELKTPISSIKMSAQLLTDGRVGSISHDQEELIQSIRDDSDRLLKITGELLNMAQLETGNIQLIVQPVAAAPIVEQALQAVQVQASQRHIRLRSQLEKELPIVVADAEKSAWVMINFLTNAIKFSPENAEVSINVFAKEDSVHFTVRDYGKGIDEKFLPRIFDRYFRVPGTNERNGSGLGLAISREFIEAQQGRVWVESEVGSGSLFGFSLKVSPTAP